VATVYDQYDEVMEGVAVSWSITAGVGSFVSYDEVTDENGQAQAMVTSNVTGNSTVQCEVDEYPAVSDIAVKYWEALPASLAKLMPLWYILGLVALAVGAWFSQSIIVNIMLMIMCAGGFELADASLLAFSEPLYYCIRGVLICGIVFALIQIFTRVKHI
jgi:hypothetical protein